MTVAAAVPSSPSRRNRRRRGGALATLEDNFSAPLQSAPKSPSKRRSAVVEIDEPSPPATVAPGTPPKKSKAGGKKDRGRGRPPAAAAAATEAIGNVVTPSESPDQEIVQAIEDAKAKNKKSGTVIARRSLSSNMRLAASSLSSLEDVPSLVSSSSQSSSSFSEDESSTEETKTLTVKKGPFGRAANASKYPALPIVKSAYSAINTRTGSLGGNGHGGAIYGELTVGSMQKMIEMMKEHTGFSSESRFIDVGCGLGKPNIHVAMDPAVEFSYGCEMEGVRWWLAMSNLDAVLQGMDKDGVDEEEKLRCMLAHADMTEAKSFDPFTHVYMFDIGFPPALFYRLANMYNKSVTPEYMICYHGPRLMIDRYGFDLELLAQTTTSMHGSSEAHMGYVYKRIDLPLKAKRYQAKKNGKVPCDPLFRPAYDQVCDMTRSELGKYVRGVVSDNFNGRNDGGEGDADGESGGPRRSRRTRNPISKYA
uniref:DOT1 domain-containing protein n=1 Tax=Odontella aurita TaxID=265563 RepID=A0A7S4MG18_9STRA